MSVTDIGIEYLVPTRGLLGYKCCQRTRGRRNHGTDSDSFDEYKVRSILAAVASVAIAQGKRVSTPYALFNIGEKSADVL